MNEIQEKIKRSSRIMAIIVKVLYISLIIGMCVPIAIVIWVASNPGMDTLSVGKIKVLSMQGQLLSSASDVMAEMCTIIVAGIFLFFILLTAYRIFRSIAETVLPFSIENSARLKKIGINLMVYSFVLPIARAGFYASFSSNKAIQTTFDIPFIALALVFIFIALVFDYGAELQRQSDETL